MTFCTAAFAVGQFHEKTRWPFLVCDISWCLTNLTSWFLSVMKTQNIFCDIMRALICKKSSSCSTNDVRPFRQRLCKCAVSGISPRNDFNQKVSRTFFFLFSFLLPALLSDKFRRNQRGRSSHSLKNYLNLNNLVLPYPL
jgi:hypothetical protein